MTHMRFVVSKEEVYLDESKILHHTVVLSPDEMLLIFSWPVNDIMSYICDKAHCHPQQVYRVSWFDDAMTGLREYILDVDPSRIIVESEDSDDIWRA